MSLRRVVTRVAAAGALLLVPAVPAAADVVFDPADAEDLAAVLAEATAAQDVCYGWTVRVDDQGTGVDSGVSTGSSFGAGVSLQDPRARGCATLVELVADITYTSESSESEDSASYSVISTPRGPTTEDLEDLDMIDSDALVGEQSDDAVGRAVTALPQLATEAGVAPPLVAEPQASAPPDVGALSDDPGSDYLRNAGGWLAVGAVLLVGGVAFGIYAVVSGRSQRAAANAAGARTFRDRPGAAQPPGQYPPRGQYPPQGPAGPAGPPGPYPPPGGRPPPGPYRPPPPPHR